MYWIRLPDGAVQEASLESCAAWLEALPEGRQVARTEISEDVFVSTAFLCVDHGFGDRDNPVLWETMIFGGPEDQYQERYTSEADALLGHGKAVAIAQGVEHESLRRDG